MRKKLIDLRKKRKQTQQGMAEKLEIARTTYTEYESGNVNPTLDKAIKIKKILKTNDDSIFDNIF